MAIVRPVCEEELKKYVNVNVKAETQKAKDGGQTGRLADGLNGLVVLLHWRR